MNTLSEAARRFIGDIHSLAKCFESGAKFSGFTMPITIIDTCTTPSRSFNPFRYGGTYFIIINNVALEIDNLFKAIKKNEYYSKELGDIYVIKDNCM